MKDKQEIFSFGLQTLLIPLLAVLLIWVVFWIEIRFSVSFRDLGIYPRRLSGLKGIFLSPFIHSSVKHLYSNSIPLFVLLTALLSFYRSYSFKVVFWGIIIGGSITWLIGRESYHIGASGLIYTLASFIFFKGVFTRHFRLIALSLGVVFLYGGLLWYLFPIEEGISWEGHAGGFIAGLLLAFVLKNRDVSTRFYEWEQESYDENNDPFLRHFDKDGNFIPASEMEEEENEL